jgi:predicted MFS family arabinose efflux permease
MNPAPQADSLAGPMTTETVRVPLHRNRDFLLLQAGQVLSDAGIQSTAIAYPLLVLAVTGSPAQAGLVGFVRVLALAVWGLPAGLAADRWNRKRLMITADAVRVVAVGTLAVTVLADVTAFWMIPLIAFVEGGGAALFHSAYAGALRSVVPAQQLPAAAGAQTGRMAAVRLVGPPLGGALFGLGRAVPFLFDAASYVFSILSVRAMRTPFQGERVPDPAPLRTRLVEGVRFLWNQPFLRACTLLFSLGDFIGPGIMLAVVVLGDRAGLSGAAVGLLVATFGASLLVGSMLSPLARRLLSVRAVLLLEFWTWIGCVAFVIWPSVYVLVAAIVPTALAIPSTNSVVHGYRIAMTPDRLIGRVESVHTTIALMIAPFGPLLAGILLDTAPDRVAIGVFAAAGLTLAVCATLSPALRSAPSLDDLAAIQTAAEQHATEQTAAELRAVGKPVAAPAERVDG